MALFGAPIAHEDHADRALRAALAIQEGLEPLRADVRGRTEVEFRMRIGINTGLVVVGAIGKDLRMDYTAVGDTTNLAARLLGVASPARSWSAGARSTPQGLLRFEDLGDSRSRARPSRSAPTRSQGEIRGARGSRYRRSAA